MLDVLLPCMAWMEGWMKVIWALNCSYFGKNSLGLIVMIVITLVVITKKVRILWNCLPFKVGIIFTVVLQTTNLAHKNLTFVLHFSGIIAIAGVKNSTVEI